MQVNEENNYETSSFYDREAENKLFTTLCKFL